MDDFVQVGKGERFSDRGEMGCGEFERERAVIRKYLEGRDVIAFLEFTNKTSRN